MDARLAFTIRSRISHASKIRLLGEGSSLEKKAASTNQPLRSEYRR